MTGSMSRTYLNQGRIEKSGSRRLSNVIAQGPGTAYCALINSLIEVEVPSQNDKPFVEGLAFLHMRNRIVTDGISRSGNRHSIALREEGIVKILR